MSARDQHTIDSQLGPQLDTTKYRAPGFIALSARGVLRPTRVVLAAFAVLTALATNQLFVLPEHTERWFSWTIDPPLTAAFLGAGYAAGFVLVVLVLSRPTSWVQARVAVVTILIFTVLTLVPTLQHTHRFHYFAPELVARFAAWFWLAVYLVVPVALALLVVRQHRVSGDDPPRGRPLPRWLAAVLAAQGAIMVAVGLALFVVPSTATTLWPWHLTPLTAAMVAAWLIAFGTASGLALWERDLGRLQIPAMGYTVFGLLQLVALARFLDQVQWGVPATAYVAVLVTVPPVGAAGWWLAARSPAAASAEQEAAA